MPPAMLLGPGLPAFSLLCCTPSPSAHPPMLLQVWAQMMPPAMLLGLGLPIPNAMIPNADKFIDGVATLDKVGSLNGDHLQLFAAFCSAGEHVRGASPVNSPSRHDAVTARVTHINKPNHNQITAGCLPHDGGAPLGARHRQQGVNPHAYDGGAGSGCVCVCIGAAARGLRCLRMALCAAAVSLLYSHGAGARRMATVNMYEQSTNPSQAARS